MPTPVLGLLNGTTAGIVVNHTDWNAVTDELELFEVQGAAQLLGPGILAVADFNLSIGAGTTVDVSAGRAWVGDDGARRLVRKTGTTNVPGLTTAATYIIFLNRDGTFTAQTSATPPANSLLVGKAVSNGTAITSVNSGPGERLNLPPYFRDTAIVTAAFTVTDAYQVVLANATTAAFTVSLPTAVGRARWGFAVKRTNSGANAVTVDPAGTETIDSAATKVLGSQGAAITFVSDGLNWHILAQLGTVT